MRVTLTFGAGLAVSVCLMVGCASDEPDEDTRDQGLAPPGAFVYAIQQRGGLRAYRISPGSGALENLPGSPFQGGFRPRSLALHPSRRFLYVADDIGRQMAGPAIYAYDLDRKTGTPALVDGFPIEVVEDSACSSLTIEPQGRFLSNQGFMFGIDRTTPTLTRLHSNGWPCWPSPRFEQGGRFAYRVQTYWTGCQWRVTLSCIDRFELDMYAVDSSDGRLPELPGSGWVISRWDDERPSIQLSGELLFLGGTSIGLSTYRVDTGDGSLTRLSNSYVGPVRSILGTHPRAPILYGIVGDPHVADGTLTSFRFDVATGVVEATPRASAPVDWGCGSEGWAIEESGQYGYLACQVEPSIRGFKLDEGGGLIALDGPLPPGRSIEAIVAVGGVS